jgi:riboflavin synthase
MFTGLVEVTGNFQRREPRGGGFRIEVATALEDIRVGESIAVAGVCLTVAELREGGFKAELSAETASRTTLCRLQLPAPVNLERALRPTDRLGGHFVAGHVDSVAEVTAAEKLEESVRLRVKAEPLLGGFLAPKGSVALDGVSLTVNSVLPEVTDGVEFELMVIPHTLRVTTLGGLLPGDQVNIEVDLIARYITRYLQAQSAAGSSARP